MFPSSITLTALGAALLWFGWFGFNAGSQLRADGVAGSAFLVTNTSASMAALSWMFSEWLVKKKPTVLGLASGVVAGLVAITPAAGFVNLPSSISYNNNVEHGIRTILFNRTQEDLYVIRFISCRSCYNCVHIHYY